MKKAIIFAAALLSLFCIFGGFAANAEEVAAVSETTAEEIEAETGTEAETTAEETGTAKALTAEELESILADASPAQVEYIKGKIEAVLSGMEGYSVTGWDKLAAWVSKNIYAVSWAIFGIGAIAAAFVYVRKNKCLLEKLATMNNNSIEIAQASHEDSAKAAKAVEGYAQDVAKACEAVTILSEKLAAVLAAEASAKEATANALEIIDTQRKAETDALVLLADSLAAVVQCSKINDARKDEIMAKYESAKKKCENAGKIVRTQENAGGGNENESKAGNG